MSEQMKNINCRVCLRYDIKRSHKCFSLFETHNNSLISEKIKYVANIEIREGDGLPSKICADCLLQLETAIVFKGKCETSNKILHSIAQKSKCQVTFKVPVKKEIQIVFDDTTDDRSVEFSDTDLETIKSEKSGDKQPVKSKDKQPVKSKDEQPVKSKDNQPVKSKDNQPVISKVNQPVISKVNETENVSDQEPDDTTEKIVKKSKAIDLKLICDDCGGSFKSKCKIAVHWKKVHLPNKLICPCCKRTFKTFKALNIHEKKKTRSCQVSTKVRIEGQGKTRLFHCKECTYNTKQIKDMDAHLVTHSGDRRFQCKDCFKCFTQHSSLQGHRESAHCDYRVETTCHYCGKHIKGRGKYYKHLKIHQPNTVQCEVCKKILKSRGSLNTHMKRHSGVRSYTCERCSANFYTNGELCNHRKKVHFKSKSFKCDMCEYTSYTASLLNTHKSRHTLNNVICLMCGKFVESAEKLAIHQKRHIEKNFSCTSCDKGFYRRDSLRRHIVKKHVALNKKDTVKDKVNIKQECPVDNKFDNVIAPIV